MLTENWTTKKVTTTLREALGDPTFRGSFYILNFYSDFLISFQIEDLLTPKTPSSGVLRRRFAHKIDELALEI